MLSTETTTRRTYDHRIRDAICASDNPNLFPALKIPRSTAVSWIRRGSRDVVQLDGGDQDLAHLRERISNLERRVAALLAVVRVLVALVRLSGFRFDWTRVPDASAKAAVLRAVSKATKTLELRAVLRILRMSPSRYHSWRRAEAGCELQDAASCPRSTPTRLTPTEAMAIKDMALDEAYRHLPITRLALLAQRLGRVFVIDNFSRRLLAWRVASRLEPATTRAILEEAASTLDADGRRPVVVTDSGSENVNGTVDELLTSSALTRVLALVEVSSSNSKIEAFWRSLRHGWLYLNELDTVAAVERLVGFYVEAHNTTPHSSFRGPTPGRHRRNVPRDSERVPRVRACTDRRSRNPSSARVGVASERPGRNTLRVAHLHAPKCRRSGHTAAVRPRPRPSRHAMFPMAREFRLTAGRAS